MPTPSGLPKVGEVWELAIKIPGHPVTPKRVVVIERSGGDYWSLRVAWFEPADPAGPVADPAVVRGHWRTRTWVDASYHRQQGWLRYIGPAGPNTKAALGLG
jgi:hypothetical protein